MELLQKEIEKGQTLLIVVLVMVISLTVGLSVVSKTITNLRTTTEEADSAKALSAAPDPRSCLSPSGSRAST